MKKLIQWCLNTYKYLTHREIKLSKCEITWIKLFKLHYKDKIDYTSNWLETMKPIFIKIYGWNPDEDNNYHDYLNCIFSKLLDIHLKIHSNKGYDYKNINEIFNASFNENSIRYSDCKLPIERAISALAGEIQCTKVIESYGNYKRTRLNLEGGIL